MTHIVNDRCINCKYTDCVEVCPVDCFYEGENMLVISPDECIDCGVCIAECPVDAIVTDEGIENIRGMNEADLTTEQRNLLMFHDLNARYSKIWKNIKSKKSPLPEAEDFKNVRNKTHLLKGDTQV